jgi:imidazolonepropionase
LLAAGAAVALATDCNPGTGNTTSMPFVIALAVREMGLTPGEAVLAATIGSAKSLRRNDIGRVVVGARAELTVLDAPSHVHLSYRAGVPIARALDLDVDEA